MKNRVTNRVFGLLVWCLPLASYGEDLLAVYRLALANDPQLLAEAASQQAVAELAVQSEANFQPTVELTINSNRNWQDISSENPGFGFNSNGGRKFNNHDYALTLTQPLYRKQNFIQQEQANIAIDGAAAGYDRVYQSLIVRVAELYFDVLARRDDQTFALAEREAIGQQLEQTTQRFEVGIDTIIDVTESQAAYDLAHASVISAENELKNSKERLRELLGQYIDSFATLERVELVRPQPEDIEQWSATALAQNPAVLVAQSEVEDAKQAIELQKSNHFPTLDLVGRQTYNHATDGTFGYSKTHQTAVGLQFNLPLDVSGRVRSQTREASHRLDQAMQNEEQQQRSVIKESREAYNSVISGISQVEALCQAITSNEKALESTEAGYEVGTRTTVEVLNVRRDLFRARRDYANARYSYILASLRLKQAAGTITEHDVQQINKWLSE